MPSWVSCPDSVSHLRSISASWRSCHIPRHAAAGAFCQVLRIMATLPFFVSRPSLVQPFCTYTAAESVRASPGRGGPTLRAGSRPPGSIERQRAQAYRPRAYRCLFKQHARQTNSIHRLALEPATAKTPRRTLECWHEYGEPASPPGSADFHSANHLREPLKVAAPGGAPHAGSLPVRTPPPCSSACSQSAVPVDQLSSSSCGSGVFAAPVNWWRRADQPSNGGSWGGQPTALRANCFGILLQCREP